MSEELKSKFYKMFDEKSTDGYDDGHNGLRDYMVDLMQAACDMTKADEWVSVETELPDNWQEVIVLLAGNVVRIATYIENKGYEGFYSDINTKQTFSTVTHWHPLPTPPNQ